MNARVACMPRMGPRSLATWCRSVDRVVAGGGDDAGGVAGGAGGGSGVPGLAVCSPAALAPSLAPLVSSPPTLSARKISSCKEKAILEKSAESLQVNVDFT